MSKGLNCNPLSESLEYSPACKGLDYHAERGVLDCRAESENWIAEPKVKIRLQS